ncbi:MAG: hypothetical protein QG608_1534 [Actinomycetota bacterium]|nr:hypothetical protein [Actinomycetota bacterium]
MTHLRGLDEKSLVSLLRARPDVLVPPVPRNFDQLAQRLSGDASLLAALEKLDRDALVTGQAIAVLPGRATFPTVADLLTADPAHVRRAVKNLERFALGWETPNGALQLPERLADHWSAEIGVGRPFRAVANSLRVGELREAGQALGVPTEGLLKAGLIDAVDRALADHRAVAEAISRLPIPAQTLLEEHRHGLLNAYYGYNRQGGNILVAAGLAMNVSGSLEIPCEVSVASWLRSGQMQVTGPPVPEPTGTTEPTDPTGTARRAGAGHPSGRPAAETALRDLTALLDAAANTPLTSLKKGGIGPRERSRLSTRLGIEDTELVLWIDLAFAAGLLGQAEKGYAPTADYPAWRESDPARRWAALADAWYSLRHSPTHRDMGGDKDLPPPLPLLSRAGVIRRSVLATLRSGVPAAQTFEHLYWYCPLHGYSDEILAQKAQSILQEGQLLGVLVGQSLSDLGRHLLEAAEQPPAGRAAVLTKLCEHLLPRDACTLVLQSDLTAVVSGQPSAALSRLLMQTAVNETRGPAGIWRFTPQSVRSAMDAGRQSSDLLEELREHAEHELPQPLIYLIEDVARRHGKVRVRGMRSCVIAQEAIAAEILHTRGLKDLHLSRLAPTVLGSPQDLQTVLQRLRGAGFLPLAEDATGTVIVQEGAEQRATAGNGTPAARTRPFVDPERLASDLLSGVAAGAGETGELSRDHDELARLGPQLCEAELELLSEALAEQTDVLITYFDRKGHRTTRLIRPQRLFGRWLDSWCHLRGAQRDFSVSNIEAVEPAT